MTSHQLYKCPNCGTWQHSLDPRCPKCHHVGGTTDEVAQSPKRVVPKDPSKLSPTTRRRVETFSGVIDKLDTYRTYTRAELISMMVATGDRAITGATVNYLIDWTERLVRVGTGQYRRLR